MLPEQGTHSEGKGITSKISSTFRLIREFPSIYVQSLRDVLAGIREQQDFHKNLTDIRHGFAAKLAQTESRNQALREFSDARNEIEDLLLQRLAKQPRILQGEFLALLDADIPSLQETYGKTGKEDDRYALEDRIRLSNKLRKQINESGK